MIAVTPPEIHRNLLLIAGTGTKTGKTSIACRVIRDFDGPEIFAIKITPHFHETTKGLLTVSEGSGYSIYEETDRVSQKDTSRMLAAGAHKVYFAKVWDNQLFKVFKEILSFIPEGAPIICESPALRFYVEPGLFIIMTSNVSNKQKNINGLLKLPHVMFELEKLDQIALLPIDFEDGKWISHNPRVS